MTSPAEILWNKMGRQEQDVVGGLGVSEKEKTEITDRNAKAWKHNFFIRGQQMYPWALAYWLLWEKSFGGSL